MGTYDETIYTAACDVCDELFGTDFDWSLGWHQFPSEAEEDAVQGGWTVVDGQLICESQDDDHQAARHVVPDTRPKPGHGQLTLI
jgi:hypothetical protein